jgi:hypothetical protein
MAKVITTIKIQRRIRKDQMGMGNQTNRLKVLMLVSNADRINTYLKIVHS